MTDDQGLGVVLSIVESAAARRTDGHLTLMRFTTGWKVMLGTPDLDSGHGRDQVLVLSSHSTLAEALRDLLIEPTTP